MKYKKITLLFGFLVVMCFFIAFIIDDIEVFGSPSEDFLMDINKLEAYLEKDPENLEIKRNLAFNYLIQEEYTKARSLLEDIILVHTDDLEALHQLSLIYLRTEEYILAKNTIEKMLEFNNHNSLALINLAQINLLLNNYDEFSKNLKQAILSAKESTLSESQNIFYLNLEHLVQQYDVFLNNNQKSDAYQLLGENQIFESIFRIKCLELAISEAESSPDLIELKGFLELEIGKLSDAYETFLTLTQLYPEYEYGHYMIADIAFKTNDTNKLLELRNEYNSTAMLQQFLDALILYRESDQKKAIEIIEELLNTSESKYQSMFIFNLLYMKSNPNENLIKKFYSIEDRYVLAILFNREFKHILN